MRQPQTEDRVELIRDLPELCLHAGDAGVVCSTWFMPNPVYEVEFRAAREAVQIRALMPPQHFRVIDQPLIGTPSMEE